MPSFFPIVRFYASAAAWYQRSKFRGAAFTLLFVALTACATPPAPAPVVYPDAASTAQRAAPAPVRTAPAYPDLFGYRPPPRIDTLGQYESPGRLTQPASADQPVRIGLLLPLSGPEAEVGEAFLRAAQLALFDFGDPRLVLLPRDTAGTAAGAREAAATAIEQGAQLLLGPVFAGAVAGAAVPARASAINMIAFSTDRQVAGDGVYLLSFLAEQEVARIVDYAASQQIFRFAAMIPDTAYGDRVAMAFQAAAAAASPMSDVQTVTYPDDPDAMHDPVKRLADYDARRQLLSDEIRRLERSGSALAEQALKRLRKRETLGEVNFDAVLIPDGGPALRALAPLLPYYEIDPGKVQFLGTGLWNEPLIHREPPLVGGWFPAPPPQASGDFARRMTAIYGAAPPAVSGLAYDVVALAAVLARRGGDTPFSRQALTEPEGFAGILGIFRLRPDGLSERGLAILEVGPKGLQVIDPAPTRFGPMFN